MRAVPLRRPEANEVLRYWLASLQLDEALAARPRARRPLVGHAAPRLDAPSPGHDYFKLPLDASLGELIQRQKPLHKDFDAELGAFFETWLSSQYRRGEDDRDVSHLIAFPVVHLPRGDLAGLLRYAVRVRFGDVAGPAFKVPTRSERRRKIYPAAPSEVRVTAVERGARQWPFFIDTRLLQQQLGVARESIDAFFTELRALPELDETRMLELVCSLLEGELTQAGDAPQVAAADNLLSRIAAAMSQLLHKNAQRARVYPVGIVVDGTRAKTTWYLQRELQMLIEEHPEVAWEQGGCLGAYLTGDAPPIGVSPQGALFRGPTLSTSQRIAAERTWGSRLTAVQGPPGTGKTTLILHLAAQAIVKQVEQLADAGEMGSGTFVVSSTNNRAVDNVIDPLNPSPSVDGGLPLALRAGSQRVCEHQLSVQLQHAHHWLSAARMRPVTERKQVLTDALAVFAQRRTELADILAAHHRSCDTATKRNALLFELTRLNTDTDSTAEDVDPLAKLSKSAVQSLYEPLQKAHARLQTLNNLCSGKADLTQLNAVDKECRRAKKKDLPTLEAALRIVGLPFEIELPPPLPPSADPKVLLEAWEEAAAAALAHVEDLQLRLARALGHARTRERVGLVQRQLAALPADSDASETPRPDTDALEGSLFEAAVRVREAWAALESDALSGLVQRALSLARTEYSLRSLWSDEPEDWTQLRRLFGVWGCTLLSLGNCFPARSDAMAQVVIDEAGQCHPAYAVSALMRSRCALIIGDVHQLEPVIDLELGDDDRVIQSCKLALEPSQLAPYRVHSAARCSVQALADRAVLERPRLTEHFRCQPPIIAICDQLCGYGLSVRTPAQQPAVPLPFLTHPVMFVDVPGEQERLGGSWHNAMELALTLELTQSLFNAGLAPEDLAVITPYRGQLEQLQKQLVRLGIPIDNSAELMELEQAGAGASRGVTLGTVHRFQGGERSVVIFSSVVTRRSSLPFLDQRENLLNVAVSRARHRLIVLGDRALLAGGERTRLLTQAAHPLMPDSFRAQLSLI